MRSIPQTPDPSLLSNAAILGENLGEDDVTTVCWRFSCRFAVGRCSPLPPRNRIGAGDDARSTRGAAAASEWPEIAAGCARGFGQLLHQRGSQPARRLPLGCGQCEHAVVLCEKTGTQDFTCSKKPL